MQIEWTTDLELTGLLVTGLSADPSAGAGLGLWLEHGAFALRAAGSFMPARWLDPERDLRLELTGAIAEVDAIRMWTRGATRGCMQSSWACLRSSHFGCVSAPRHARESDRHLRIAEPLEVRGELARAACDLWDELWAGTGASVR